MSSRRFLLWAAVFLIALPAFAESPLPAGADYDVGFSPGGGAENLVIKAINSATKSLHVAAYELTSVPISEALVAAVERGVEVKIVADAKASRSKASQLGRLRLRGVGVRLNRHYAIFHHKFMVVDHVSIETGSFNYTKAADTRNAENALVVWRAPEVARKFEAEWQRAWDESVERKP